MANPFVPTPYKVISTASTNAANIKNAPGQVTTIAMFNPSTTAVAYVKLYDKATSPTVGTDVPKLTFAVAAASGSLFPTAVIISGNEMAINFPTGISIAITGAAADADSTNAPAGVVVNVIYK